MHFAEYESPVGRLLLRSDGKYLTGLWIGEKTEHPLSEDAVILKAKLWLDSYFRGEVREIDFPVLPEGTAFQKQVWQLLTQIPCGAVRTYGGIAREMAERLGKERMSAQAVGQAVGSNPVSIVIPCHRCVGAKGQLRGYAWGIEKKKWLLRHEGWLKEETT